MWWAGMSAGTRTSRKNKAASLKIRTFNYPPVYYSQFTHQTPGDKYIPGTWYVVHSFFSYQASGSYHNIMGVITSQWVSLVKWYGWGGWRTCMHIWFAVCRQEQEQAVLSCWYPTHTCLRAGPAKKWINHPKVVSREPLRIWTWNLEALTPTLLYTRRNKAY